MIVHLADYAAEYTGNFIYSLISLSTSIRKEKNIDTLVILPMEAKSKKWIKKLNENSILVDFVDMSLNYKSKYDKVISIINKYNEKPLIIHTHFARFEMVGVKVKKYYNCKLIWHMHMGFKRTSYKHKIYDLYKINCIANRYVDNVIPVSHYVEKLMLDRGVKSNKIRVVPNGIYLNKHTIDVELRSLTRSKLNINEKDTVVVMFGYDIHTKGTDIVFKSLQHIDEDIKVIFVGKEMMIKYIQENDNYSKYKDKIILINHTEDISKIFNTADIFVSASRVEAFSYSISEAMLYNLPIIMSDIEGTKFYKEAGEGVITYRTEDYIELGECINNIKSMSLNKREALGKKNRKFVLNNFNVDIWTKDVLEIYKTNIESIS